MPEPMPKASKKYRFERYANSTQQIGPKCVTLAFGEQRFSMWLVAERYPPYGYGAGRRHPVRRITERQDARKQNKDER